MHKFALLFATFSSILFVSGLRVENLHELNRDAFSITIEWTINDAAAAAAAAKKNLAGAVGAQYSAEDSFASSREQLLYEINEPSPAVTSPPRATNSGEQTGNDEWIGFKIKYFTERLQYPPVLLKNANLRKFRLDNLKSDTEYKIQVSAFNKLHMEGPASNLLVIRTKEAGLYSFFHFCF